MKMSELAPGGRLHCGSEIHPKNLSRDTMYFLQEKDGLFVFACKICTEIKRSPQIHAIMKGRGGLKIFNNTRKATVIDRDEKNRIISFR